jgi:DAK2 domain fusion protein YloV
MQNAFPLNSIFICDGVLFQDLVASGLQWLSQHTEQVNRLNVFPVPDGDTGVNMHLTLAQAYAAIQSQPSAHLGEVLARLARGAVHGSRGNSGTILSQIVKGFASTLSSQPHMEAMLLREGLQQAVQAAYASVQSPTEGTILTVIREIAAYVAEQARPQMDLVQLLGGMVEQGWASLARTPDLLPPLKKAGVVDSGGAGLMYILEGMWRGVRGEPLGESALLVSKPQTTPILPAHEGFDWRYPYDVQFLLEGTALPVARLRAALEAMGDSGVIVGDESLLKVHIHVADPGQPLSYAVQYGNLREVVVENMRLQAQAQATPPLARYTPQQTGVVVVASGAGWRRIFASLGVGAIVDGGQSHNPSTQELLDAALSLGTADVLLLPNNKNVILTAQQAAQLSSAPRIHVIPTTTIPQAVAALVNYDPDAEPQHLVAAFQAALENFVTGEITQAVRDVEYGGLTVRAGQFIALLEGEWIAAGEKLSHVLKLLLEQALTPERERVTLYWGAKLDVASAQDLGRAMEGLFPAVVFEVVFGGQPHYHLLVSIE